MTEKPFGSVTKKSFPRPTPPHPNLHTGGRRRLKTLLPERVDVFPQGAARLRVPGGVALF